MKNLHSLVLFASVAAGSVAHGAVFVDDFSGLAQNAPLVGYNNWTQSESNSVDGPYAWGSTVVPTPQMSGFAMGPAWAAPTNPSSLSVSHDVGLNLIATVGSPATTMQTSFVVWDSDNAVPYRNDYSIGIYSTTGLLFSLNMTATSQDFPPYDPLHPEIDTHPSDLWNVSWSSDTYTSPALRAVYEGSLTSPALYTMNVTFTTLNVSDVQFSLTLSGLNTAPITGTLLGVDLANAMINEYRVTTTVGTTIVGLDPVPNEWGDGYIEIAGVSVVPEPGAAMLVGLGALGLIRRRRSA